MPAPLVVFDLTPLDTSSRLRGFGRYVRTLALGLAALPRSAFDGMRLVGLTHLGWDGSYRVTEDLASFAGEADVRTNPSRQHLLWAYRERVALARAMHGLGASLLHIGAPDATPLGLALTGCKRLVTCHDLIEHHYPKQYLRAARLGPFLGRKIVKRKYVSADHVLAISDATARDLRSFIGLPASKITRVYNSIDTDAFRPEPQADDAERVARHGLGDRPFLIYVGDLDWRKNVEGMMGGLARARALGADVTLALAGKLSEARLAQVDAAARAAGVEASVKLLGYVDDRDLAALYRRCLAHLFVSRIEGFGLTVGEAMACGAPVITTHGGSLGEVAGDAGMVVDPEDHSAIGRAIAELARDERLRDELRAAGPPRARSFSVERQARETLAVYRRMLSI